MNQELKELTEKTIADIEFIKVTHGFSDYDAAVRFLLEHYRRNNAKW